MTTIPIASVEGGDYFDAGHYGRDTSSGSMAGFEEATIVRDSAEWRPALAAMSAPQSLATGATIAPLPLFSTTAQYPLTVALVQADQTSWVKSPATQRRMSRTPAPLALRVVVMVLAVVFVIVAATGLGVVLRPSMFPHASPPVAGAPAPVAAKTTSARFALLSSNSSRATYNVPTRHYTIVISVTHPCWVTVKAATGATVFAKTLLASASPADISVTGATHLTLAAQAISVLLRKGAAPFGTISAPKVGLTYAFQPVANASP